MRAATRLRAALLEAEAAGAAAACEEARAAGEAAWRRGEERHAALLAQAKATRPHQKNAPADELHDRRADLMEMAACMSEQEASLAQGPGGLEGSSMVTPKRRLFDGPEEEADVDSLLAVWSPELGGRHVQHDAPWTWPLPS